MVRGVLIALAVLFALILVVVAIGYALPVGHVASRNATLSQPPDRVYAVLTDVERYPQWRKDVTAVQILPSSTVAKRWLEKGSNGDITFEFVELQPSTRIVSRIADPNLPFGGTWTYELMPESGGTRLTITERGEVYNPLFRFMSRFVFGHTATMEQFLDALKQGLS